MEKELKSLKEINTEMLEALEEVLLTLKTSNKLHDAKCHRKINDEYIKEIETLIKKTRGEL